MCGKLLLRKDPILGDLGESGRNLPESGLLLDRPAEGGGDTCFAGATPPKEVSVTEPREDILRDRWRLSSRLL